MLIRIVNDAIEAAAAEGLIERGDFPPVKIEYPKEERFGDYATPFALESARVLRKSPMDTAAILAPFIERSGMIEKVEVAKPGFINMFLSDGYLYGVLDDICRRRDDYGKNSAEKPMKVNIEFVSANPTGPLNIVSARAAAVGDSIANILEACGHAVDREFYVNDYGNQVHLLGRSVLARYRQIEGKHVEFPEDGYHGEYIWNIAQHIQDTLKAQVDSIADEEKLIDFMAEQAVEYNLRGQRADLDRFNVRFDNWFRERGLHERGEVLKSLDFLESRGSVYTEEGRKIFRSTDFGDDKDRVILRDDGRPTYFLADIAYHKNKIDRGYDTIIDIWGPDHHGYIARLSGAMNSMGFTHGFKVLIAQQVNLVQEGELVKMSKRLGKFSTMSELLDDIGTDVARYFFVMRSLESHLDFDLALAKRQSSENPVFYLQYAHARICSIFREAESRGFKYDPGAASVAHLRNPEAVTLMKLMAKFPEEISDAAATFEPHRISTYMLRLAQAYHKFYTEHRVLADDAVVRATNMKLCDGVRIILKNGLALLGVSAPERM